MVELEDMRVPPTLEDGETVELVASGRQDAILRDDVVVVVTDDRIVVSPKRGRTVDGFEGEYGNVSIDLDSLSILRRSGLVRHTLEVVTTEEQIFELPSLSRDDAEELVEHVVERCVLDLTDYGRPTEGSNVGRTVLGVVVTALAALGVLVGLGLVVTGIALTLTFVGVFLGIFLGLVGALLAWGSWTVGAQAARWSFGAAAEWRRNADSFESAVEEPVEERG